MTPARTAPRRRRGQAGRRSLPAALVALALLTALACNSESVGPPTGVQQTPPGGASEALVAAEPSAASPTLPAQEGAIIGDVPSDGGIGLVVWGGGSVGKALQQVMLSGCDLASMWASRTGGGLVGYIAEAPPFVNREWDERFGGVGLSAGSPLLLVCRRPRDAGPAVYRDSQFEVQVTEGVVYAQALSHDDWRSAEAERIDLTLDVYAPQGAEGPRPAIVLIHGGGFRNGDSQHWAITRASRYFASRGWVAFAINYRLAGEHGTLPADWPEGAESLYPAGRDAKAAVRWIRAHAAEYDVDSDSMTALGASAGAYVALALGVTDEADYTGEISLEVDPTLATTNRQQSARVQAVVDHWGGPGMVEILEGLDGRPRFDVTDAPVLIFHGTGDRTVEFENAEEIVAAYKRAGVPVDLYPLDGGHAIWNAEVDGRSQHAITVEWLAQHLNLELR